MRYKILQKKTIFNTPLFHCENAKIKIDSFKKNPITIQRYNLHRPQVAAVLPVFEEDDSIILVEQFRYASLNRTHLKNQKSTTATPEEISSEGEIGWSLEIPAGLVEPNEDIQKSALRELLEETGYKSSHLQPIFNYYPSIGLSNQIVHLFYSKIQKKNKIQKGGGLSEESEDIKVHSLKFADAWEKFQKQEIFDSNTLLALQWYALKFPKILQ